MAEPLTTAKRTHLANHANPINLVAFDHNDPSRCTAASGCRGAMGKPAHAFWYEVDDDWKRWCRDERFGIGFYVHEFVVELGKTRMLVLDCAADLDEFTERYRRVGHRDRDFDEMDWERVGADYDGIEIAPYQWSRRLSHHTSWYYGWDCASGAIWRPRGATVTYVGAVSLAEHPEMEVHE